jgi:hypothetical protein
VRDVRGATRGQIERVVGEGGEGEGPLIFFSDAVKLAISSTDVRSAVRESANGAQSRGGAEGALPVPPAVAGYIEKYRLYTDNA